MNEGKRMYADLMNLLLPLLPSNIYQDVRRVQTLAWALVGICLTQTVRLGAWAEVVDSRAQLASSRVRRFARWLHQGAISPQQWYEPLLLQALRDWRLPKRVYVALGRYPLGSRLELLQNWLALASTTVSTPLAFFSFPLDRSFPGSGPSECVATQACSQEKTAVGSCVLGMKL